MAAVILDATGKECPEPLNMAIEKISTLSPGETLIVQSTDPVSSIDFEAWCLRKQHQYLGATECDGVWDIRILIA